MYRSQNLGDAGGAYDIGMGRADSEFILITEGLYLVAYRFREATTLVHK